MFSNTSSQLFIWVPWNTYYDLHFINDTGEVNDKCGKEVKTTKNGFLT